VSAALLAAGALLLAGGHGEMPATPDAPTTTDGPTVTMTAQAYQPRDVVALVGETVTWTNTDGRNHTVTESEAERFESGVLTPGRTYTHVFDEQGTYRYQCTIHRFMAGSVRVFGLALDAPAAVMPGAVAHLVGRVPVGSGMVVVERLEGEAFVQVAHADPDAGGAYDVGVPVTEPGTYRVRTGELTSRPVVVSVQPHVAATAMRRGRTVRLMAHVDPPRRGAVAVLQRYVRERFAWQSVARAPFGAGGMAHLTLRTRNEVYLRVVASRLGGGWADATSRSVRVRALP
jgi:plastocyanin